MRNLLLRLAPVSPRRKPYRHCEVRFSQRLGCAGAALSALDFSLGHSLCADAVFLALLEMKHDFYQFLAELGPEDGACSHKWLEVGVLDLDES